MKSRQFLTLTAVVSLGLIGAPSGFGNITIDTVLVGHAGNSADALTGLGAVNYQYAIGKYEVTLNQYTVFLNAVAATDTYGLYNPNMAGDVRIAGIVRSGASGSYEYSVVGSGERPVTYVSWFDAARFANWLQNGQPTGAQTAATTESGSYSLSGAVSGVGFTRNPGATYYVPTENEWYKAAYYHPTAEGGPASGYWLYPTRSAVQPNSRNGSTTDPNSANYFYNDNVANGYNGGYAVNNSTVMPTDNALTDVGAFSLASSFYGTFDQGGNVWEWTDAVAGGNRRIRGGSWALQAGTLRSTTGVDGFTPQAEIPSLGFRIAMIPEPNALGLMAVGTALFGLRRKLAR